MPLSQPLAARLVALSRPLAAQLDPPNKTQTWAGGRALLCGQRLACSVSQQEALRERLRQARAGRETWTPKQWERVVQQIGEEDWGVVAHGGRRAVWVSKSNCRQAKEVPPPRRAKGGNGQKIAAPSTFLPPPVFLPEGS